jgi:hypothetical protein
LLTGLVVALPVILICALITVRSIFLAGAICTEDELIVRGMLWSRRIPRTAIEEITESWAVVVWRGMRVGKRFTPMTAFFTGNSAQWFEDYNHAAIKTVREWVKSGPDHQSQQASSARH